MDDLLGVSLDKVHTDRLYAGLDRLYAHKESIEKHPRHRAGELFEAEFEVLIYDLTSTYFEGKAEGNAKAARGYSRNNRSDCKQVCIGLVVTPDGFLGPMRCLRETGVIPKQCATWSNPWNKNMEKSAGFG